MPKTIDGILQKELLCKNDECMALLGYFRVYKGVVTIYCRKCGNKNNWRIGYSKGREEFDKLVDIVELEGEKNA